MALIVVLVTAASAASKEKTLYNFDCNTGMCGPLGALVFDASGNLYGTTGGTIFEVTPDRGAATGWTLSVLHWFTLKEGQGIFAGVVFDASGNLYGTAVGGGVYDEGAIFELSPGSDGWTENTLYSFCSQGGYCTDGQHPFPGVIVDKTGVVYGVTRDGGYNGVGGVAFKLTPGSDGWAERVIHTFGRKSGDGGDPYFAPAFGKAGHLFGSTWGGGDPVCDCGVVFELAPVVGGWHERVLYTFKGEYHEGNPYGGLVVDTAGDLYGTTTYGGSHNQGTVFKLSPSSYGHWNKTTLYDFPNIQDGGYPLGTLAIDRHGALYGIAGGGGGCGGTCGLIYKLAPQAHGKWKYTVLHKFNGSDGMWPQGGVVLDKQQKHLYGTTQHGGANSGGVVFEITP